jgi:hypothetical protein
LSRMFVFLCALYILQSVLCDGSLQALNKNCGQMSSTVSLIQGGYQSDREAFPWIVNIFTKYQLATLYAGSGSLISDRHILCAANSVAYENYLDDSLDLDPDQVSELSD